MFLILLLTLFQITQNLDINYDEDISLPVPEVILDHSPVNEPAPQFLTLIHDCICRQQPGKYVVCFGYFCKEFPANLNITVPLFKMKLSSITVLDRNSPILFTSIRFLEIESNINLEYIEPGFFRNMINLKNLTISFNEKLSYLEENVFEGLINLSTLSLRKNGFTAVIDATRALNPKYVPELFLLQLNENVFEEIKEHEFHPMNGSRLEQLNIVLCEIDYIHPDALIPLKYLQTLRIGQNHFNSSVLARLIERSTEFGIPLDNLNLYRMGLRKKPPLDLLNAIGKSHIRFLHLIENHFDELDDESFPYMPNLIQLSLRGNIITDISSNAFRRLPKIESILLTVNRLVQVPDAVLLPTLIELDLAGNTYSQSYPSYFYISNEIFKNMSNLKYLTLAYNNICYLSNSTFVGLSSLKKLNLKDTSLTFIKSGTFMPLKNLTLLNLINNPFPKYIFLKADLFQGLSNLEILLLNGCSIKNISIMPSLFTYTPNLRYLGLERNELYIIGPRQLAPLIYLESLNINENKLPSWNKPILGINSTLKSVSAISNKFTTITTSMLEDFSTAETLFLDGNPFTCDCSLYSVALWLRTHKLSIKFYSDENFVASCVSPAFWRHKSIMTYITTLSTDTNECENRKYLNTEIIISLGLLVCLLIAVIILGYVYRYNIEYCIFMVRLKKRKEGGIYNWDVYVSYSDADEWFITELINSLEPEIKLCLAERDLTAGDLKSSAVVTAVASSRRSLLIVSQGYVQSSWCRWETELVVQKSPIVIHLQTINIKDASLNLRYLLKTRIYLRWPGECDVQAKDLFWQKLKFALYNS